MRMLSELKTLHMRVADTRVVASQDENILLVKRFDQHKQQASHHFLSANALINQHTITHQALTTSYSYGALAEFIMKYVAEPRDAHELYARMIFNILMGNTDDHARNHAFLYSFTDKCWRLSPAYDVLPINNARQQAIGVGDQGRTGSIENALSQCKRFGLSQPKAKKIVATVQDLTAEWQSYFAHCGVSEGDIRILKRVIAA
jgi:serine/threonine-protein kinase HipA